MNRQTADTNPLSESPQGKGGAIRPPLQKLNCSTAHIHELLRQSSASKTPRRESNEEQVARQQTKHPDPPIPIGIPVQTESIQDFQLFDHVT